jgi:hypothetical protein
MMDLFAPQSPRLAEIIRQGRSVHDAADLEAIKAEAARWRPSGYDAHQAELRRQYEGHILGAIVDAARRRFPSTAEHMPHVPFNLAATIAEKGAAVYDRAPRRFLRRGADVLTDGDEAAAFASMVEEADLEAVMPEAERRQYLARTVFLHVRSDSLGAVATGRPPRTMVHVYWPCDVFVIPHPLAPYSMATCVGVLARTSASGATGGDGGITSWEFWSRSYEDDEVGMPVSFGPWRMERITEERTASQGITGRMQHETHVTVAPVYDPYPLPTLPWIAWHAGIVDGMPYLDANRNLVPLINQINVSLMSELHIVDMCAAPILVHKTRAPQPAQVALGPGIKAVIDPQDELSSLSQSADLAGIRATNRSLLETLALTLRQSTDAFVPTEGGPASGVALAIKNEPQSKARREAKHRAVVMERELLRLMCEVHEFYRGITILDDETTCHMQPADPPDYEDRETAQRRAIEARDARLISPERAAVEAGWYQTEDEAKAAMAPTATAAEPPSGTSRLGARLRGEPESPGVDEG